jgi:hypothetical protein
LRKRNARLPRRFFLSRSFHFLVDVYSSSSSRKGPRRIGYQGTQITVEDIVNSRNGWREIIANDQAFKQYRSQAK